MRTSSDSCAEPFFLTCRRCRFLGTTMAGLWWATGYELGAPGQLQGCRSRRQHPARGRARFLPEIPARQWLKLKTRGFVPAFSDGLRTAGCSTCVVMIWPVLSGYSAVRTFNREIDRVLPAFASWTQRPVVFPAI